MQLVGAEAMDQEAEPRVTQDGEALTRHRPALLSWFRRRLRDAYAAEDLCQETLVRFLTRAPELADESKTRPYLFRTARNLLADHFRRRRPQVDLESLETEPGRPAVEPGLHPPEARAYRHELEERLRALLPMLPADRRQAFELGVLFELPYAEVARRQGWTVAKVKVEVYRARKTLIEGLQPFLPDPGAPERSTTSPRQLPPSRRQSQ